MFPAKRKHRRKRDSGKKREREISCVGDSEGAFKWRLSQESWVYMSGIGESRTKI